MDRLLARQPAAPGRDLPVAGPLTAWVLVARAGGYLDNLEKRTSSRDLPSQPHATGSRTGSGSQDAQGASAAASDELQHGMQRGWMLLRVPGVWQVNMVAAGHVSARLARRGGVFVTAGGHVT